MADTILSPIIDEAISKVISFAGEQIRLVWGFKKELARLEESLRTIQGVLQVAEEKQESDLVIRNWLHKLRDVAYDAVDVLDEYAYKLLQMKVETQGQMTKQVCRFFSGSNSVVFRLKMANKIRKINESLVEVRGDAVFPLLTSNKSPQVGRCRPQTDSYTESKVEGRDKDVLEIVNLLTELRGKHSISGISLTGMAGIGKTTLAKLLCKEVEKRNMFDVVAWVCVSDDFDELKILNGMLKHLDHNVGGIDNMNVLLKQLEEKLEKKTFLLVLDDVWNEDSNAWATFVGRVLKIVKTPGNSIFVTTRNERVASSLEKFFPWHEHQVQKLVEDDCWLIIKEKVFGSATSSISDHHLEAIGRDIAKQCGGLPLIANVLGGTMRGIRGVNGWLSIKDRIVWDSDGGDQILSVLKLSFDHLPSHLKKCFSYCSIFPKDFDIEKDDLVQLWMAQGFINPSSQGTMEDIGNKYFNNLLSNSLFQDVQRDIYGNIKTCKMHDVVHDLAVFVSKNETLILKNGSIGENSCIRHLRFLSGAQVDPTILRGVASKLHSFFSEVDFCNMSLDLKSIRSLSLKATDVDQLPASLGKLKHLRYLDVSETNIKALPKSFTKLYNLQTLKLIDCYHLQKLPDELRNLISLKHFYFDNPNLMPREIGHLTSLQTLSLFAVGTEKGYWIDELGPLSQLRGALRICNLEFVRSQSEATRANLKQKTKLYALKFEWVENEEGYNHHEEVLEGLQPHPNLRSLEIFGYDGQKFPSWSDRGVNLSGNSSLLNNLLELMFYYCDECTNIPNCLGLLPSLQVLRINGMKKVKCMGSKFYLDKSNTAISSHGGRELLITLFPTLKELYISNMNNLEEWAEIEDMVVFPCLEILRIYRCPSLKTWSMGGFSSQHKLSDLQIHFCQNLMAIPNIDGLFSLKTLSIYSCENLISLPGGLGTCISLQSLSIWNCSNLISIVEDIGRLHWLTDLAVYHCEELVSFPKECLGHLTHLKMLQMGPFYSELEEFPGLASIHHLHASLETLELCGWDKLESLPHQLQQLTTLKKWELWNFNGLEALPEWLGNLSSLATLRIKDCNKLKSIPENIGELRSLTVLVIRNCEELKSFPEECLGRLTHLKKLHVGPFWSELEEFPGFTSISHLHASLEILEIRGWDKLKSLPQQLQYLTTLRELWLLSFESLEALPEWLQNLSSLQDLRIWSCPNLMHLPSVEAMCHLSNLQYLHIWDCPKLKEKCAKESGPEWFKISHIPVISI